MILMFQYLIKYCIILLISDEGIYNSGAKKVVTL